jgi:phosphoglycolate phosphatase
VPDPRGARFDSPVFVVRLVLFDLDGTLVHSAPDLATAVNHMLTELGRDPQSTATVMTWIGNGMVRLIKRALTGDMHAEPEPALFEQALASFKKHYAANLAVQTRPYAGALKALDILIARGFALGCVTNKPAMFTLPLLERLDLARYFGLVVSGDSLARKKPDPLPLQHACAHFGVAPADAVLVGDSAADVTAARAAGMPVIGVSYGYNQGRDVRELKPDRVVDSLTEVPQYLQLFKA